MEVFNSHILLYVIAGLALLLVFSFVWLVAWFFIKKVGNRTTSTSQEWCLKILEDFKSEEQLVKVTQTLKNKFSFVFIQPILYEKLRQTPFEKRYLYAKLCKELGILQHHIQSMLESPYAEVRAKAAKTLALIHHPDSISYLLEVIEDQDEEFLVKQEAINALWRFQDQPELFVDILISCSDHVRSFIIDILSSTGTTILGALQNKYSHSENERHKLYYAHVLTNLKNKRFLNEFRESAINANHPFRAHYINFLGHLEDKKSLSQFFTMMLKDPDQNVAQQAALVVGKIANENDLLELGQWVKHPDYWVRFKIIKLIKHIGALAEPYLIEALEDESEEIFYQSVLGLEKLCFIERNMKYLASSDREQARHYSEIFTKLGRKGYFKPLLEMLKNGDLKVKYEICSILGNIGNIVALDTLTELTRDKNWTLRAQAAKALGQVQDAGVIVPLIHLMRDEEETVRDYAVHSLTKIRSSVLSNFFNEFDEMTYDKNYPIRVSAVQIIRSIGRKESVHTLLRLAQDKIHYVRMEVARALASFETTESIEGLIQLLKDKEVKVQEVASESLKIIFESAIDKRIRQYFMEHQERFGHYKKVIFRVTDFRKAA
ncbi:MAG TPA: HEAT repeat domain-containing protein [Bdellovibrionota bacterium]|nr:HEAT repeat domain-containing protein [Bdellovibrionota bacterium]